MGDFTKLQVWQKTKSLAISIYKLNNLNLERDFRYKDQLRSAAVSISSNIAEGDELNTNKQSIRHFYIAKGSCAEVKSLLIIGKEIEYINTEEFEMLYNECESISKMLYRLIQKRSHWFPKPYTRNPTPVLKPRSLNFNDCRLIPYTLHPTSETLDLKPETR